MEVEVFACSFYSASCLLDGSQRAWRAWRKVDALLWDFMHGSSCTGEAALSLVTGNPTLYTKLGMNMLIKCKNISWYHR